MKENISIIFAAIIGIFLLVILPLYSILDRQDSMSYNVVLTATTNFVDSVRNKGFIDKDSYTEYIRKLSTTGNTYNVKIQAYKNVLIPETDEDGDVILNSFIEEKELYNTQDILKVLEDAEINNEDIEKSSKKTNVYLFNENDEIYITVYNTNITAGSIIYNMIADVDNNKVIDISYGGVINNINWELYDKIQSEETLAPEVVMSVPVNRDNSTNVQKVDTSGNTEYIDCSNLDLENYEGYYSIEELCSDYALDEGENYTYLYDLSKTENKTIKVAVELRRFDKINIGADSSTGADIFVPLSELSFTNDVKQYIIKNYIRLNGMEANIDLNLRSAGDYYVFNIILTNVRMSILDFISTRASIEILPGLGQDENETLSLGGSTIEIELLDETIVNTVVISEPYIWQKLLRTKSFQESKITDNIIYANVEIAFIISYTGINNHTDAAIKQAIKNNLDIFISNSTYSGLEFYTANELNDRYEVNIATETAGHVLVKFKYNASNSSNENYIRLRSNWINTGNDIIVDPETGAETQAAAEGAVSKNYQVLSDTIGPVLPSVAVVSGDIGLNGWYTSNVKINLNPSENDRVIKNGEEKIGGSGVLKSTITITGVSSQAETETTSITLTANGTSYATPKAYDFVGNQVTGDRLTVKIDQEKPTAPVITLTGDKVNDTWYTSDVLINITPGEDSISKVDRTTYTIDGANVKEETKGTRYTITNNGTTTITATTYDKAGNSTKTQQVVNIDDTVPKDATFEIISGDKNSQDNEWFSSNVRVRITVDDNESISGLGSSSYEITGSSSVSRTYFSGSTKDIILTTNGTHVITVNTYTVAGLNKTTTYTVKIDKNAPKEPLLNVVSGEIGDNDWYVSNVQVQVVPQGDDGPSNEITTKQYTITSNGTTTARQEINNNGKITFNQDGEYTLKVYAWDMAGNEVVSTKHIKIDKSVTTPADFVITGEYNENTGWYVGNVNISYTDGEDSVSGIKSIDLSHSSITTNTNGTVVRLTTTDNAGNTVIKERTIKLDKSVPIAPTVELLDEPTGTGISGWSLYNKDVSIKITPREDIFISGVDNYDNTIYRLYTSASGYTDPVVVGRAGTEIVVTQEGKVTIIVDTYDKAGNKTSTSKNLWIDKSAAKKPSIESINGEIVLDSNDMTVVGTTNTISLVLNNIESISNLNNIKITLINQETLETMTFTKQTLTVPLEINIEEKGTYRIVVNQTNKFGTTSSDSTGLYYYKYE